MSTKALRQVVEWETKFHGKHWDAPSVAMAELEAIERAAKDFHENGAAALQDPSWGLMTRIAKESK